uniref:Uncharacterized protein n=1 Tax=Trichogramma kaykai TaxID=54128 RepID=A0ABD2XB05_9HYME
MMRNDTARYTFIASAGREKKALQLRQRQALVESFVNFTVCCCRERQAGAAVVFPAYIRQRATRDSIYTFWALSNKHTARDPRELRRLHFIISRSLIVFLARFAACYDAKTIVASRGRSSARDNAKCLATAIYYYEPLCTRCAFDDDDDDDDDGTQSGGARHQAAALMAVRVSASARA